MSTFPIPRIRDADPALLAGLREVDPSADLVYLGEKRWMVMRMRPLNDARIDGARRMMATLHAQTVEAGTRDERAWYQRYRATRMHLQGYTVVSSWTFDRDPDWRVVQDFRERAWRLRHDQPYDDPEAERERAVQKQKEILYDPSLARLMAKAARNPRTVSM